MSPYLLAAGALIVFLYVIKNHRSSNKLPPSPPSLPLIGHLHLIGRLAHRSLHELQLRYGGGGGLLYLQLGRRRTFIVSTAAAAADLFRNHDLAFASRPHSVSGDKLMYGCNNVSFAPYGGNWRRGKKIATVAALVARTRRAAEAGSAAVELRELLYGYTNAVITRAATDVLPDAPARFVRWATGLDKKLDDMAEAWDKFLSELVAAHKEKRDDDGAKDEDEDFLDVLLRLREEGTDGLELTEDRIKAITKDMIAAATETSTQTLEWTMAELDEIVRVVSDDQTAIAEPDLNKMEYLKAVFKEVLRLHPPAPLLVPHESTTPAVVQGYEIPAKTALFVNSPVDFRGTDYQLIPFGAGRRICPGINFALPVLELALASLLRHFEWELPAGMRPGDLDMGEAPGLSTPRQVPLVLVPKRKTLVQAALE
ncbi:hypothetical protein BDA96_08G068800 [Sorghum bicolor]|uniref:Cytochrome P450 n=1 Tax=Sorghum bicolor TaxID=4558 RepID=A0A921U6P3_SORBI|nr:hypothetical protein BDA96_08G068800 [Sorghum bicolor]